MMCTRLAQAILFLGIRSWVYLKSVDISFEDTTKDLYSDFRTLLNLVIS
eukprot:UN27437